MKKFKLKFNLIISGLFFLGALIIMVPLIIERIFWSTSDSIFVTKWIFFICVAFFLIFLGIIVPNLRRIFYHYKLSHFNPFDALATILIISISAIPLLILKQMTIFVLKNFKNNIYIFLKWAARIKLLLHGVWVVEHDLRNSKKENGITKKAQIIIINHSSHFDYDFSSLITTEKWSALTGRNLTEKKAKPTFEDVVVKILMGSLIKNYSIVFDRDNPIERSRALRKTIRELEKGTVIIIFPEGNEKKGDKGGRTSLKDLANGTLLREFEDPIFEIAFKHKIPIGVDVLILPAMCRGKNDERWGIHPGVVDKYSLPIVNPEDFNSVKEFKNACWNSMHNQLKDSKKVKKFLKDYKNAYLK